MPRSASLVLAAVLTCASCGDARAPLERDTVQALALEPARGASATARQFAAELLESASFPLAPGARWSLVLGTSTPLEGGGAALATRPRTGGHSISLSFESREFPLERCNALVLRMRSATGIAGRVHFKVQRPHGRLLAFAIPFDVAPGADWQDVRVELSPAVSWDGAVRALSLSLDAPEAARVELRELVLARPARAPGYEALGEGEADPRPARDVGLVARGRDGRRAHAADLGQVLEARASVPRDGLLAFAVTEGAALEAGGGPFEVEVSVADAAREEAFHSLGALRLTREALASRWTLLRFPLAAHAGADVRVRIVARAVDGAAARPDELRERVLFSAPLVLGARPAEQRPNVLLVTLDTTRADAAPGRGFTPNLDRLAARGLVFRQAFSTCNSTTASHASMMTGLLLSAHGALDNLHLLPGGNRTLAELFRERGWHTAAAVSAEHLNAGTGFGQGFDEFWNADAERHDGRNTVRGLQNYFEEWGRAPQRPFFAWLHLFDAHTPYGPPPEELSAFAQARGVTLPPARIDPPTAPVYADYPEVNQWANGADNAEHLRALYHLGVAWADDCLGRVLDDLERRGWLANTLVVVTADHGEAFGEHDSWYTHLTLHDEIVHVPLVVAGPLVARAAEIDVPASGLDLYPTLARVAGAPVPGARLGVDLFELAAGRTDPARALYFQLERAQQAGSRTPRWHFIDTLTGPLTRMAGTRLDEYGRRAPAFVTTPAGTAFLYDVPGDPLQARDVAAQHPDAVEQQRAALAPTVVLDAHGGARLRVVSPEQLERLQQLGYMGK
jgi:arylsulfatase A-like enzyme